MDYHCQDGTDEYEQQDGKEAHIRIVLYESQHIRILAQVGSIAFQIGKPHEQEGETENEFTDRLAVAFLREEERNAKG